MIGHRGYLRAAPALLLLLGCQQQTPRRAPWLTMPSVTAHAAWFPIGPADVHGAPAGASPDCNACHQEKATGQPSATFRTFTCTGCHVEIRAAVLHDAAADLGTLHAGVAEYGSTVAGYASSVASPANGGVGPQTAEDGACLHCHPSGMATVHQTFFPLPHENAARTIVAVCADCHLDYTDRSRLGCAGCHPHDQSATAAAHATVPGFAAAASSNPADVIAASALCVRCHGDGTVPVTVTGHAAFSGGFVLGPGFHWGVTGGACLDCHPAPRTAKPFAADFAKSTCGTGISCHGAAGGVPMTIAGAHDDPVALGSFHATQGADFAGQVMLLGFDAACLSCHPDGGAGLPANHPFPVGAATSHALTCSGCHTTTTNRNNPANFTCALGTCHTGTTSLDARHSNPVIPVTDYVATSARCLYCHGDSQVNRAASHPGGRGTPFADAIAHLTAGCANCHRVARTDKPFAANWGATDCRGCHDTATGPTGD